LIDFTQQVVDSNGPTAISEYVISDVNVYPNPVHDLLSIDIEKGILINAKLTIYNVSGHLIQSHNEIGNSPIVVSSLVNGVYFYSISSGQKISYGKFIKQ
jgi:hypothetical protein